MENNETRSESYKMHWNNYNNIINSIYVFNEIRQKNYFLFITVYNEAKFAV